MSDDDTSLTDYVNKAVSYVPLALISMGVIGNIISFSIFVFHKEMKKYNSVVFLSFIAVLDTIALFEWNLDNYFLPHTGIVNYIEYMNLFTCKLFSFLQYTSLQSSGMLYSMVSVDRYFTVISKPGSFISKLPFGTRRSSLIWSIGIVACLCIVNSHVLLFNGYYETVVTNSTVNTSQTIDNMTVYSTNYVTTEDTVLRCYASQQYQFVPMWDRAHMIIYTFIPFTIMTTFNVLLIVNVLYQLKNKSLAKSSNKDDNKRTKLTVSLIVLTMAFIIFTTPAPIAFGFFLEFLLTTKVGHILIIVVDILLFSHQTTLFFISFLTNKTFYGIVVNAARRMCGKKETNETTIGANKLTLLQTLSSKAQQ